MKWLVLKGRANPRNRRRTGINVPEVLSPAASRRRLEQRMRKAAPVPSRDNKASKVRLRPATNHSSPVRENKPARASRRRADSSRAVNRTHRTKTARLATNPRNKGSKASNPINNLVKANRVSKAKVRDNNLNNLNRLNKVRGRGKARVSSPVRDRVKGKGSSKHSRASNPAKVRARDNSRVSKAKVRDNRPNKLSKVSSRVNNPVRARVRGEARRNSRLNRKVSPASPVPKARTIAVRLAAVNELAISANDPSSIQVRPVARIAVKKPPVRLLAINTRTGPTGCEMSRR